MRSDEQLQLTPLIPLSSSPRVLTSHISDFSSLVPHNPSLTVARRSCTIFGEFWPSELPKICDPFFSFIFRMPPLTAFVPAPRQCLEGAISVLTTSDLCSPPRICAHCLRSVRHPSPTVVLLFPVFMVVPCILLFLRSMRHPLSRCFWCCFAQTLDFFPIVSKFSLSFFVFRVLYY